MFKDFGLKMLQYLRRQNASIPPGQNMSLGAKSFNTPGPKYDPVSEIFQYPILHTTYSLCYNFI